MSHVIAIASSKGDVGRTTLGEDGRVMGMPDIPYIEERKRLVELHKQEEDLACEEEKAAAPLEAESRKQWEALLLEYPKGFALDIGDIEGTRRRHAELTEKMAPFQEAISVARKPFTLRDEKLRKEIDSIEKITGSLREDEEDGGYLTCAITGLPMLESDVVWTVIAAAVPKTP